MIWETPPPILQNWTQSPEMGSAVICTNTAVLKSGMASNHNFESDYGGYLVGESIGNETIKALILQAPDMLNLLLKMVNDSAFERRADIVEAYRIITNVMISDSKHDFVSMCERADKNARAAVIADIMYGEGLSFDEAVNKINSDKLLLDHIEIQSEKLFMMYEQLPVNP